MGKSLIASHMKQLMIDSNLDDTQSTTPKAKKRKRCSTLLSYATLDTTDDSSNDDDSCVSFS